MSQKIESKVKGMTCTNCALSVEKTLKNAGASSISVDPMSGEVLFEIGDDEDAEVYYDKIDNSGFTVMRKDQDHDAHAASSIPMGLWIVTLLTVPLLLHMFFTWPILHHPLFQFALGTIVLAYGIRTMGSKAINSIKNRMPSMEVLVMIGAIAAYVYSLIGIIFYPERVQDFMFFETTAMIIVLVSWGHYLEERTVSSTTKAIKDLISLRPETVTLVQTDSLGKAQFFTVDIDNLKIGDTLLLREGENIGADAELISGQVYTDESMLTGESVMVEKNEGDQVFEGTTVSRGNAQVRVTKTGKESTLSQIITLVKSARTQKPKMQKLADNIAAIFVPTVLLISVATFFINWLLADHSISESLMRSIAVLVISCPCAMGIATPAAVMVGLGRGSKMGILIRNGVVLEKLSDVRTFIFDKTGTLTEGAQQVKIQKLDPSLRLEELHNYLFTLETYSTHPIAKSIVQHTSAATLLPMKVTEIKGKGMSAQDTEGNTYRLGSAKWLSPEMGQTLPEGEVFLYKNQKLIAAISLEETLSPGADIALQELRNRGHQIWLLSGDTSGRVQRVAQRLGIEEYEAEMSPDQKLIRVKELQKSGAVCMVGDGINDAPALSAADVSVSMSHASDIAQNTADIILLGSNLEQLIKMLNLGKATFNTIKGNLFWAFIYNIIAIPVAAVGLLSPTWGAGIMALSDVFLVINSLRLRYKHI